MRLTRREFQLTVSTAIILAAWAAYALLVRPAQDRLATLERVVPAKLTVLQEVKHKSQEYQDLRERLGALHERIADSPVDFALLPFLEALTQECGITKNIVSMTPQDGRRLDDAYAQNAVTLKMEGLPFTQLLDFVARLRNGTGLISIDRLEIQKKPGTANLLDSVIDVSVITFESEEN